MEADRPAEAYIMVHKVGILVLRTDRRRNERLSRRFRAAAVWLMRMYPVTQAHGPAVSHIIYAPVPSGRIVGPIRIRRNDRLHEEIKVPGHIHLQVEPDMDSAGMGAFPVPDCIPVFEPLHSGDFEKPGRIVPAEI